MKMFKIMKNSSSPFAPLRKVPWKFVEKYREKIEKDHGQTLERLNERGGLAPEELLCHVFNVNLGDKRIYDLQTRYKYTEIVFRMWEDGVLVYGDRDESRHP